MFIFGLFFITTDSAILCFSLCYMTLCAKPLDLAWPLQTCWGCSFHCYFYCTFLGLGNIKRLNHLFLLLLLYARLGTLFFYRKRYVFWSSACDSRRIKCWLFFFWVICLYRVYSFFICIQTNVCLQFALSQCWRSVCSSIVWLCNTWTLSNFRCCWCLRLVCCFCFGSIFLLRWCSCSCSRYFWCNLLHSVYLAHNFY